MKNYLKIVRLVATFGQLGFSLITPPVVMALLGWWLQSRFGLGTWIMLVCLVVGLLGAASSAYRFLRQVLGADHKKHMEDKTEDTVVYYTHE